MNTVSDKKPLVSISIPVLNEESNVGLLYERLCLLSDSLSDDFDMEFVFSDNHSSDSTWGKLLAISHADDRVKAIRFSKNIGFQKSILVNYMHTKGDAVVQIDADLQDPPELIKDFLHWWKKGYFVVYGVRKKRRESAMLHLYRRAGYWVINTLSDHSIPLNAGDFRLIDRKVVDALLKIKTPDPYLRGTIAGLGFSQKGVEYNRGSRGHGSGNFPISKIFKLGLSGILNHSTVPLRFSLVMGLIMLVVSIFGSIYYVWLWMVDNTLPQGMVSIHILVLFGIGVQSMFIGIIGEYLLKVYLISRSDPIGIIEDFINFDQEDLKL